MFRQYVPKYTYQVTFFLLLLEKFTQIFLLQVLLLN